MKIDPLNFRGLQKKRDLFNQYSSNLAANTNLDVGWFVCPLCHRAFRWEAHSDLSIEHVIPKALGGKVETLTCKRCNNDFGSKYIAKLTANMKVWDKLRGNLSEPVDAKIIIEGKGVVAAEYLSGNPRKVILQHDRSHPENYQDVIEKIRGRRMPEFKMRFNLGYKREYEQMAVLLICYLMLFKYFGYSYAFNRWGLFAREVLVNEQLDAPLLKMVGRPNKTLIDGATFLAICTEPKEFTGYASIQVRFSTNYSSYSFVKLVPFLPDAQFDEDVYLRVGQLSFSVKPVGFNPSYLTKPLFTVPQRLIISMGDQP